MNGSVGAIADGATLPATIGTNATAYNTNGTGLSYVAGPIGQALDFDGVDDHLVVPTTHALNVGTGPFAISLWFYKDDSVSRGDLFVWKDYALAGEMSFFVDGNLLTAFIPGVGSDTVGAAITTGEWHHVVYSRDSTSTVTVYLDGQVYLSAFDGVDMADFVNVPIYIGSNHDNSYNVTLPFNGKIDDVAIWQAELTAGEVQSIYSGTAFAPGAFTTTADHMNASGTRATTATRSFTLN
jgi:hypothetical protein